MSSQNDANTVFLSKQEAERIQHSVKDRLQKCSELRGHPREPRDSKAAISQATGASLMADIGSASADMTHVKGQRDTLPVLAVGQPYPPCIVSLQDLQPMKLSDLQMDTHHRGRRLTIKRASPVVTLTARSWTMVQDEAGDETERLEVCLHTSRHGEDVLESASLFVIKEPYFTLSDQGEATLRIDHPSDLIICKGEIANSSLTSASEVNGQVEDVAAAKKIAISCKDKGNAALKQRDLPLAYAEYTEGLKVARQDILFGTNPDLARDISRNRALVNLLMNQFDEAKTDAKASLIGGEDQRSKDLDSKAYFRAGRAAYNLGQYKEAKGFFEEQQKLAPSDKDASVNLRNIELRLREQETGTYNFKKIKANLSQVRLRTDAANFISNTKLKDSPGRGRGLFATCDIAAGEIVLCEKAFSIVWGHENEALIAMVHDMRNDGIRMLPVGLSKLVTQKLLSNPSQIERAMDLCGDYQGDGKNVSRTDDGPVVDTFRVHDIMSRNTFGVDSQYVEGSSNGSTGIWIRAAYINHSCIANTKIEYIGDLMVLRATEPILASEEIFHNYHLSMDYGARQTFLMSNWGFECDCALCAMEKADSPALRKKRQALVSEADTFIEREHWAHTKRLTIVKAQRLVQAINNTYNDDERYKGVPRIGTQRILEWLNKASKQ